MYLPIKPEIRVAMFFSVGPKTSYSRPKLIFCAFPPWYAYFIAVYCFLTWKTYFPLQVLCFYQIISLFVPYCDFDSNCLVVKVHHFSECEVFRPTSIHWLLQLYLNVVKMFSLFHDLRLSFYLCCRCLLYDYWADCYSKNKDYCHSINFW